MYTQCTRPKPPFTRGAWTSPTCHRTSQTTFAINGTLSAQALLSPRAAVGRIDSKAVTSSRADRPQSYADIPVRMSSTFVVRGETFELSAAALERCGPDSLLARLAQLTGNELEWPFSLATFASAIAWANTGLLPPEIVPELCEALMFLNVQPISRDTTGPVSLCLARAAAPSLDASNYEKQECEALFSIELDEYTFLRRQASVGKQLPLQPGCAALRYVTDHPKNRTDAPLFTRPHALKDEILAHLPREARALLDAGLILAGGYVGRMAAWQAGLCDAPPTADAKGATCDLDFFPLGNPEEALRAVRRGLLALAKDCEERENGMFVVRSQYALTIGMDDCCFDLQIILCAHESAAAILETFDIDGARLAFTPDQKLIVSETAIRALLSGTLVAQPQYQSANFAQRLHKYATTLGYNIAIDSEGKRIPAPPFSDIGGLAAWIRDNEYARKGSMPEALAQLEAVWRQQASGQPSAASCVQYHPAHVVANIEYVERTFNGREVLDEWEEVKRDEYDDDDDDDDDDDGEDDGKFEARSYFDPDLLYSPEESRVTYEVQPRPPEPSPGPVWTPDVAPVRLPKAASKQRLMREMDMPKSGYSGSAKTVVEVWRGQRRRGEHTSNNGEYWRMDYQSRLAFEVCNHSLIGINGRKVNWPPEFPDDPPTLGHWLNDVVFQQLDACPVDGGWSDACVHLASATEATADAPLKFFDFIEDAARVLPPRCRTKLPRCLEVSTPANQIFNRATNVRGWYDDTPVKIYG